MPPSKHDRQREDRDRPRVHHRGADQSPHRCVVLTPGIAGRYPRPMEWRINRSGGDGGVLHRGTSFAILMPRPVFPQPRQGISRSGMKIACESGRFWTDTSKDPTPLRRIGRRQHQSQPPTGECLLVASSTETRPAPSRDRRRRAIDVMVALAPGGRGGVDRAGVRLPRVEPGRRRLEVRRRRSGGRGRESRSGDDPGAGRPTAEGGDRADDHPAGRRPRLRLRPDLRQGLWIPPGAGGRHRRHRRARPGGRRRSTPPRSGSRSSRPPPRSRRRRREIVQAEALVPRRGGRGPGRAGRREGGAGAGRAVHRVEEVSRRSNSSGTPSWPSRGPWTSGPPTRSRRISSRRRAGEDVALAAVADRRGAAGEGVAEVEKARADVKVAQAALRVAEARQIRRPDQRRIHAGSSPRSTASSPSGTTTTATSSASANSGGPDRSPILTIARTDLMRVVIYVPDRDVPLVDRGDRGGRPRRRPEGGEEFKGEVSRFSNVEMSANRAMRVEVDLPNPIGRLREGMYGNVIDPA